MRTTLDIDDDVLAAAKELARAEGKSMGTIISELARRALTSPSHQDAAGFGEAAQTPFGEDMLFPRLPRRGNVLVTAEHGRQVQDLIDQEDATPWDHAADRPRRLD